MRHLQNFEKLNKRRLVKVDELYKLLRCIAISNYIHEIIKGNQLLTFLVLVGKLAK